MSDDPAHVHRFVVASLIDDCHLVHAVEVCECGAKRTVDHERDFSEDPFAISFARDDCARCQELCR